LEQIYYQRINDNTSKHWNELVASGERSRSRRMRSTVSWWGRSKELVDGASLRVERWASSLLLVEMRGENLGMRGKNRWMWGSGGARSRRRWMQRRVPSLLGWGGGCCSPAGAAVPTRGQRSWSGGGARTLARGQERHGEFGLEQCE
jgi:hypothetical protein